MPADSAVRQSDIEQAHAALLGITHPTPLARSRTFSELTGCDLYLKLENLQKTGSFKIRGAYNRIRLLTAAERGRGVIAASAGNHAQGVAYAARAAGIPATIVMPEMAPLAKIVATRGYGAEVLLHGAVFDESLARAEEVQQTGGQTMIHAFDDPAVIAGQGTVGWEILHELPDVTSIVVPIGGGGLISGIAVAVKSAAPHVKVYGVQARGAAAMVLSRRAGAIRATPTAVTMADGIAVKVPGDLTFPIINRYVDDIVTVDDEDIAGTILMLLERSKQMVEGAGAVGLAAVLHEKLPVEGRVVCVISGGNIDVNLIARIIERGLVRSGRRVTMTTAVVDRPGTLQRLLGVVAALRANVIHVYHDRVEHNVAIGQTSIEICLETRDSAHANEVLTALRSEGYPVAMVGLEAGDGAGDGTGDERA